jgi:ferredoxin
MIRTIIKIDDEKCDGCGLCVDACHEGAIALVDGKAKLTRDDYCDGLGNCLPVCPTGAITFEEREAAAFDEDAVRQHQSAGGGTMQASAQIAAQATAQATTELKQWPIQIKLISVNAPYFDGADLLIAADCAAFSYGNFHADYMHGKITLIGCPKLDAIDYSEKLAAIITENNIRSITVVRMTVPCCYGIEAAAQTALSASGKQIPLETIVLPIP